jgi:hypothetical protein
VKGDERLGTASLQAPVSTPCLQHMQRTLDCWGVHEVARLLAHPQPGMCSCAQQLQGHCVHDPGVDAGQVPGVHVQRIAHSTE